MGQCDDGTCPAHEPSNEKSHSNSLYKRYTKLRCLLTWSRSSSDTHVPSTTCASPQVGVGVHTWLGKDKEEFCRAEGCEGEPGWGGLLTVWENFHRIKKNQ